MIVGRNSTPGEQHKIAHQNWVKAENVNVQFSIGHDGSNIYLDYRVEEPQVRAVNTEFNSPVWEDSCVEFFIFLEGDSFYYNFEINAIGTVLGGHGPDRNQREWLSPALLQQVETSPSLGREPFESIDHPTEWGVKVKIPIHVLEYSGLSDLTGKRGTANFYKCGDKLKQPHFLSWNPVLTDTPDFHLPEYFGELRFE